MTSYLFSVKMSQTNSREKRKRHSRTRRVKIFKEYDVNAVNRRAYLTMLAGLARGAHILHSTNVRARIGAHLFVPNVRQRSRQILRLYEHCRPDMYTKVVRAIKSGVATVSDLIRNSDNPIHVGYISGIVGPSNSLGGPPLTRLDLVRCKQFPRPVFNWRPIGLHLLQLHITMSFNRNPETNAAPLPVSFCESFPKLNVLTICDGVRGPLPNNFDRLTNLRKLEIIRGVTPTGITSEFPASICKLPNLEILKLVTCGLSGQIPSEIGNTTTLQTLDLSCNLFTGVIPSSIGNLTRLRELNLGVNQLQEPIPSSLEGLEQLRKLNLRCNPLETTAGRILGIPKQFTVHFAWNLTN